MRKSLVMGLLLAGVLSFNVNAISSIVIDGVPPEVVKSKILDMFQRSRTNVMVENLSDNTSTYIFTSTMSYGMFNTETATIEDHVNFVHTPLENGTNLSINITRTITAIMGQTQTMPMNDTTAELEALHSIKAVLNGGYFFGFDVDTEKKNGGYVISDVEKDGAFDKAGIKAGDILIAVDNKKVKSDKKTNNINFSPDPLYQSTHMFTIIHNNTKKDHEISSIFKTPEDIDRGKAYKIKAPIPKKIR